MLDGDYAGSIEEVDLRLLRMLLGEGYLPVLTPPAVSREGEAIDVDGDKLATEIAVALGAETLMVFSNTAGLLRDLNDPQSTVSTITLDEVDDGLALAQGKMKKKVLAAVDAVRRGVGTVILADANREDAVRVALEGAGTRIGGNVHAG